MPIGSDLSEMELRSLEARFIDRHWAKEAGLRSVTDREGKDLVGGRRGDYTGVAIPYPAPDSDMIVTYRLRRQNPEIDARTLKPKNKYVTAPQDRNHVYFPPRTQIAQLQNTDLPILIVEGEYKALAFRRLASHGADLPRFLPIGLSGVWNWKGVVGATNNQYGVRVPVKGVIPDMDRIKWAGRNVIIAFDADLKDNRDVQKARHFLSIELRTRGANVAFLSWEPELGKGPDDWLASVGPDIVLARIAQVKFDTATGWEAQLLTTDTGKRKPLVENARIVLEQVPDFAGLALDEFSGDIIRPPSCPWPSTSTNWEDADNIEFSAWLQRHRIDCSKETAADAVYMVSARNKFHPVKNYLQSLEWDGEPRVDHWLSLYAGVPLTNYTSAAGRVWLISAVARIMNPGCKADMALLLIGGEGLRKSTMCRTLGSPWFSDDIPEDFGTKDAQLHLSGHWLLELPELSSFNKSEMTTVKAWMSRSEDIYRPPYGRQVIHRKRQCVFIATSNEEEPLRDTTGNRRFLPIKIGSMIDTDALARDRDQIWAEALELYRSGAPWWFTDEGIIEEARTEQRSRIDLHIWFEPIRRWCVDRDYVTVADVLSQAINKDKAHQTQPDKNNVVKCLQAMGWTLGRRRVDGVPTKVYKNPQPDLFSEDDD